MNDQQEASRDSRPVVNKPKHVGLAPIERSETQGAVREPKRNTGGKVCDADRSHEQQLRQRRAAQIENIDNS